jgi:uncharacterized protein (DUF2267 family)
VKAHEITSAVQQSARIDSHDHAEQAVRATLTVLGQRLSTEAKDLAAQLPPEFAQCLQDAGQAERFDLQEFYRRSLTRRAVGALRSRLGSTRVRSPARSAKPWARSTGICSTSCRRITPT